MDNNSKKKGLIFIIIWIINYEKSVQFETFQFFNGFISDNDEHPSSINENLVPLETFQFSNDFISDNDEHQ